MPIQRRRHPKTGVLWTTLSGLVTAAEFREHFAAVREAGEHGVPELVDARAATIAFGKRELLRLAGYGREVFGNVQMAPRAVVMQGSYFMMAKLFASATSPWVRMSVFDTVPAAEAWLAAASVAR